MRAWRTLPSIHDLTVFLSVDQITESWRYAATPGRKAGVAEWLVGPHGGKVRVVAPAAAAHLRTRTIGNNHM
jgi:hypothetical protein